MKQKKIGFIGCGNMASSLIGGLIDSGYQADDIHACDSDSKKLAAAKHQYSIHITTSIETIVENVDVVVLAVKPNNIQEILTVLQPVFQDKDDLLVISVAAGILIEDLVRWAGKNIPVIRTMPNTPALVGAAVSVLCANEYVTEAQRNGAESIMRAVGLAFWVNNEIDMDAVTAVSGSGPAYYFYIMEAMENTAKKMGLAPDLARLMVLQTAYGAAKMAMESDISAQELRARVTSPGGTTERAIHVLQQENMEPMFAKALLAAQERSRELSQQLKGDK